MLRPGSLRVPQMHTTTLGNSRTATVLSIFPLRSRKETSVSSNAPHVRLYMGHSDVWMGRDDQAMVFAASRASCTILNSYRIARAWQEDTYLPSRLTVTWFKVGQGPWVKGHEGYGSPHP